MAFVASARIVAAALIVTGPPALASPAAAAAPVSATPVWAAPASPQVMSEEKSFENAGATLKGTLFLPKGGRALGAVVVTHGAAIPLRGASLYRHLTEMLPPLGIAVFVYDRRGSGASGGDLSKSDYAMLADDAIAAGRMLAKDPRIDPKRIGVWGLSQGGWLSLLAASKSPVFRFAVSISAPVVTPDLQMIFSSQNALRVNGYPPSDIAQMTAARRAVDDYMRGKGERATAQRLVDGIKTKPWFGLLYMSPAVGDRATSRWRREIEHDPMATLEAVKVPMLVIYGATDPVVPVATSVEKLKAVAPKLPNMEVAVIAGADHEMQTKVPAKDLLDPAKAALGTPDSTEYFGLLTSWLTKQGVGGPSRARLKP
ncbi:alpha/beta hydrolase family protein [Phenylobacterium sp.]|jgi:hypothetical protein|uniref:alpha/beta hydrolase family protein n=1 Tax=Phenylobacterium sp. TaxID=1871053 RepID=UPI002F3E2771